MSQSAAANREADKLTQKLYKMPKARLLADPQATDCCVLCLFLDNSKEAKKYCALFFATCCPWPQTACHAHNMLPWAGSQSTCAALPADANHVKTLHQELPLLGVGPAPLDISLDN